eukprot:7096971-Lingulodinium_polyedra.AAC.1
MQTKTKLRRANPRHAAPCRAMQRHAAPHERHAAPPALRHATQRCATPRRTSQRHTAARNAL